MVEAQCQSTTQTVQSKVRKAKLLHGVSSKAHAKVVAARVSTEEELEESEEKVKSLSRSGAGGKPTGGSHKRPLEHGYKTEPKIEEEYEEEVENIQRVLEKAAQGEEEEEEVQGGGKKRKKGAVVVRRSRQSPTWALCMWKGGSGAI